MDDIYRENILDHYKHPRNFGILTNPSVSVKDSLISCGDDIQMDIIISDVTLADIRFSGQGCAISMAAASMLTEICKGKLVSDLKRLNRDDMLSLLGIPLTPTRIKCALLPLQVLSKALHLATA